jgi:hypothetical protein
VKGGDGTTAKDRSASHASLADRFGKRDAVKTFLLRTFYLTRF